MNIYKLFIKWFGPRPKDIFPGIEYPIIHAFSVGGTDYYEFDSTFNLPYERAQKTITFYAEVGMRVDRDFLEKHATKVDELLKVDGKIDRMQLYTLNRQLLDRLKWVIDGDLVYKLASVVYFDKNEDPRVYDFEYNKKKIASWKENLGVNDFFYSAPILRLIPYLKDAKINLEEYLKVTALVTDKQLENLSSSK